VETALTRAVRSFAALAAGALMVALIAALALTGRSPGLPELHFEAHGIMPGQPSAVARVEIRTDRDLAAFHRAPSGSWLFDRPDGPSVPSELASHLDNALQFMHVSEPARTLEPAEYSGARFTDFGLDPPAYVVSLEKADRSVLVADFGTLNAVSTSQYVRLVGQPTLYLMPRHVGAEWELTADMAKRLSPPPSAESSGNATVGAKRLAGLLLPASIDRIWAVEIVFKGKLHRFERDGTGNWLLHLGQHTHSGNTDAHVADPDQARTIATALAALDQTQIEGLVAHHPDSSQLEHYGLIRPMLIAFVYQRDNSSPLARIDIGNMAEDGFGRYARIAESGDVVTIASYEAGRLIDLLKTIGAAS
jgi:hypothetical protein